MEQLYILQLTNGKYYVGKSKDAMKRFEEHKSGTGSAWTSKYKPIKMIELRDLKDHHDENNVTKDLMKKYGINNVRGGSYTQVKLPDDVEYVLQKEQMGNADVCYKCNLASHFANNCPVTIRVKYQQPKPKQAGACYRCGRSSHYSPDCYASTHVKGYELDD